MKNSSNKKNFLIIAVFSLIFVVCIIFLGGNVTAESTGENDRIGNVTTLAGDETAGYADGSGTSARFNSPCGITVDGAKNLYITNSYTDRIRKIDGKGNVTTFVNDGIVSSIDNRGTLSEILTKFNHLRGIAADNSGNIYVSDSHNNQIRKINSRGNVTTLAGNGIAEYADGSGASAKFNFPQGITMDKAGNVYVADSDNCRIRKIDSKGNVTTLAGDGTASFADGSGTSAKFNFPRGIAADGAGNIYVADSDNDRIRKIDGAGNVTTLAGRSSGYADGQGTSAKFNYPLGIAVDGFGNIYVADWNNHRIRRIDSIGNVTTLAGDGTAGFADGIGTSAKFRFPQGLAVDKAGNVYVADTGNNRIRKITQGPSVEGAQKSDAVKLGALIGTIGGFEGADVVVNGKDTIGLQAPIGRVLIVDADGQYIYLQSTFPMQTIVKCKITNGDRAQIKKGMKVYLKP